MAFRGHYEHSLDAKNRLSIPARFRASFSQGLVISKDSDDCVSIATPENHERAIERALGALNPLGSQFKQLQRYYQGNSWDLELDASGRVTIPPPLLAHAGIKKEVVVAGVGDRLEVWSGERWNKLQDELDATIGEVTESLGHPS